MSIIGELTINAIAGRSLRYCEPFGNQDPYLSYKLGEYKERTKAVKNGGTQPQFEERSILKVTDGEYLLRVRVYVEDSVDSDQIGETTIDITKALQEGDQDAWFPIYSDDQQAGELYLELTFNKC